MAARRRRKTTRRRRRNPVRGTGALIINPRRKRRVKRRRATARKRRVVRRRRNSVLALRTNRRRRTYRKRRKTARKPARRRTYLKRRRRSNPKRKIVYRYRKARRKTRRKNSVRKMTTSLAQTFRKIPVIGPLLANMVGFIGPAAFGALGVEPTMQVAKLVAPYAPQMNASLFYALSALGLAAIVNSKWNPMSKSMKEKLAIGIASAGGGVAYYKWRTGQDASLSGEYGMLEYGDFQYAVIPGYGEYGAVEGDSEDAAMAGYYADASYADALGAPSDFSLGELQVALSGPRRWRRKHKRTRRAQSRRHKGQSQNMGQKGHRWGWLIRLIGFSKMQQIAQLPPDQRRAYIEQLKSYALEQAGQALDEGGDDYSGDYGALMYAV